MARVVIIRAKSEQVRRIVSEVEAAARRAMKDVVGVVHANVVDLTPRWKGGLQESIQKEVSPTGLEGRVYTSGVVAAVMEANPPAQWTKMPPFEPIRQWVEGKLGLSGKEAARATMAIRGKIKARGIQVPLTHDKRGGMFRRTAEKMERTKFHLDAFVRAIRQISGGHP
jgi:hypothetical protein